MLSLSPDKAREQVNIIRQRVSAPVNMNFFCHTPVELTAEAEARGGLERSASRATPSEHGLDPAAPINAANRAPFDAALVRAG